MIPAIVLAAGSGHRMGGPKALLPFRGETLLHRATRIALKVGCHPVLAVIGDFDPRPLDPKVQVVSNPQAAEGMASSIRAGIRALPADAGWALFLTVDQVAVDAALLLKLLGRSRSDPHQPVACAYADTLGIPAILPRRLFPELLALRGDQGAKAILVREQTTILPFPKGSADLDTPEDLRRLTR